MIFSILLQYPIYTFPGQQFLLEFKSKKKYICIIIIFLQLDVIFG